MVYVQYYYKNENKFIEPCGDRSVVILDGRNSIETMKKDAVQFNGYRRPVYDAYRIFKGETFSRSNPITELKTL